MSIKLSKLTGLNYTIFLISFLLLGLSISTVAVEAKVLTAFKDIQIQYPTSSIAEWSFIDFNPTNIDGGPAIGIFVAGSTGLVTALATMLWAVGTWLDWRHYTMTLWGLIATLITFVNTAVSLAVMLYVYVTEASAKTPEYLTQWNKGDFTREHYVCEMVPGALEGGKRSAAEIWGFQPCGYAQAARYELVAISSLAILLTILSIVEAWRSGAWRLIVGSKQNDVEKGAGGAKVTDMMRQKNLPLSNGLQPQQSRSRSAPVNNIQVHVQLRQPDATKQGAWSHHFEWYGKQ